MPLTTAGSLSASSRAPASGTTSEPFRVLIAGGAAAALEGALARRELAGERVSTTLLAPGPEFVYRPMAVREHFGYRVAERYPIAFILIPFLPGVRDLPRRIPIYELIWRDDYAAES